MDDRASRWSRRDVLGSAVGGVAAGLSPLAFARALAAAPREIRIADPSAMHEMTLYAVPEFLPAKYATRRFTFGTAGTSQLAAMMNGACDVMSSGNSYLVTAKAEGADMVAVCGVGGKGQAIVSRDDRRIGRLEDLRGKRLVTKRMTSSHVMLQIALRALGIDPKREVEIMDVGQPAGFNLVVERGDADAGQLWEPFVSIAAARPGIRKLELERFFNLTWKTHSSMFVTRKLIEEEPDLVRDLVAANMKAIRAVNDDRGKYIAITQKYIGQPEPILNAAIDNCDPRVEMDATMFYRMAEEMFDMGMIRNDVAAPMEAALDYRFVSELTGRSPEDLGRVSYADYKAGKRPGIK